MRLAQKPVFPGHNDAVKKAFTRPPRLFVVAFGHCHLHHSWQMVRMFEMGKLRSIAAVTLFCAAAAFGDTQWKSAANGGWNIASNWTNGIPSINGGQPAWFIGETSLQHTQLLFEPVVSAQGIGYGPSKGGGGFTISDGGGASTLQLKAGGPIGGILNHDTNTQVINVPISFVGPNTTRDRNAAQTLNAAAGDLVLSGVYHADASTLNNNGGELTVDGAFNTTIGLPNGRGDIVGSGGLAKKGTGALTLGGTKANLYLGDTLLYSGTLVVNKQNAFGTGGLTLFGGTFKPNGYAQIFTARLGLQGDAAIDFGSGAKNELSFGDTSAFYWVEGATLRILHWNGDKVKLRFGTSATALTPAQLKAIVFPDAGNVSATIDAEGYVTPRKQLSRANQ